MADANLPVDTSVPPTQDLKNLTNAQLADRLKKIRLEIFETMKKLDKRRVELSLEELREERHK